MNVTITCNSPEETDYVYALLADPLSGIGVLSGSKICVDESLDTPNTMVFELTKEENIAVKQLPQVTYTNIDDQDVQFASYTKVQCFNGRPSLATFNSQTDCMPSSLHYCQTYEPTYTHDFPVNGLASTSSLSTIDCSNVDVLLIDSGIDITHPDFFDQNGVTRVVNFNWTQLRDDQLRQIVTSQASNYYQDTDGHGTACASLVAGNRCGFARNAKIYMLKSSSLGGGTSGFSTIDCLKLAKAFQNAKRSNLFGLSSNRPTVFSNSWNYSGPLIARDLSENPSFQQTKNLSDCIGRGPNDYTYNQLPGLNDQADALIREIIDTGVHTFIAAGNLNVFLSNNPIVSVSTLLFRKSGDSNNYAVSRTQNNNTFFSTNTTYSGYSFGAASNNQLQTQTRHLYSSPNIGRGLQKSRYPVHIVGDVIPIGSAGEDSNLYFSGANSKTSFSLLSSINSNENRIIINNSTRYQTLSGPFFVKSAYSSFGPDIDVFAPGNGAWSAVSNQSTTSAPTITISGSEKYRFFNGTSSATPIAAGVFATYISQNPTATVKQGYDWMQNNSIKGNIMETQRTSLSIENWNGDSTTNISYPFGSTISGNQTSVPINPERRVHKPSSGFWSHTLSTIQDLLFCNRFFQTKNLICQAFPLRRAVVRSTNNTAVIAGTTLSRGSIVDKKTTH
jgi:subtilisin family serine protease